MKRSIQEGKELIIQHIEEKLSSLRAQRDQLQQRNYPKCMSGIQAQLPKPTRSEYNQKLAATRGSYSQKVQLERDGQKLKTIYERKKELENCGINISNPSQIDKYFHNKKWIEKKGKMKEKEQQKIKKLKIVEEQMIKAKQFLNRKKVNENSNVLIQKMNYTSLLKQKSEQLSIYQKLISKPKLSALEKDELLFMTFEMLRQWNKLVQKQNLQAFLFANPGFCSFFYITVAQIKRDLEVFVTKDKNMFTYAQYVEFIKSIQITNPLIQPSQCKKMEKKKKPAYKSSIGQQIVEQKKKKQVKPRQNYRKVMEYIRKLFKNFDRGSEGIVQRSKFTLGLEKGLLLPEKENLIKMQDLRQISTMLSKRRIQKIKKNYYNELDSKFINFSQIQQICKLFYSQSQHSLNSNKMSNNQSQLSFLLGKSKDSHSNPGQLQYSEQSDHQEIDQEPEQSQGNHKLTQDDYAKYGWFQGRQANIDFGLRRMDQYYKNVSLKYTGNLIQNDGQEYRSDFQQLQQFIKFQQQQAQTSDHEKRHKDIDEKLDQVKRLKKT